MLRYLIGTSLLFLSFAGFAAQMDVIELKDGSTLSGEVVGMSGGVYTVRTSSLGVVKLPRADVVAIRSGGKASSSSSQQNMPSGAQIQAIQSQLMGDTANMSKIMQMQNDPAIQQILSDPALMSAIQANDYETLQNNPKIKRLLQNSTIQSISQQVR